MPDFIKITEKEILETPNYYKLGELVSKKYWREVDSYDNCVLCGKKTPYLKSLNIDFRVGYIEGAGQTCPSGCNIS